MTEIFLVWYEEDMHYKRLSHYKPHVVRNMYEYAVSSIPHWEISYTFSIFLEKQKDSFLFYVCFATICNYFHP